MSDTTSFPFHPSIPRVGDLVEDVRPTESYLDRAADIIERATRGAHTTAGHPMKISDHTARIIAESLADEGMLMWARVQECDAR